MFLFLKLLPTIWPFLKELLLGSRRTRGGKPQSIAFRVFVLVAVFVAVFVGIGFDFVKTLYVSNDTLQTELRQLKNDERDYAARIKALNSEKTSSRAVVIVYLKTIAINEAVIADLTYELDNQIYDDR